jgi:hypothetical protein
MLAIVTARLERLFEAHREKAYRGDIQATNACLKVCAHLASMHGLYMPSIAFANNNTTNMVIDARPANSMDKLEAALNRLIADQKAEAAKAAKASEPVKELEVEADPAKAEADEVTL